MHFASVVYLVKSHHTALAQLPGLGRHGSAVVVCAVQVHVLVFVRLQ